MNWGLWDTMFGKIPEESSRIVSPIYTLKEEDLQGSDEEIAYLTKYMEKTGEKIVYSKGLPQFFISDVMENDVVCPIGQEDKKLLLFDDFECWDEGEFVGNVSREVIERMRKVN